MPLVQVRSAAKNTCPFHRKKNVSCEKGGFYIQQTTVEMFSTTSSSKEQEGHIDFDWMVARLSFYYRGVSVRRARLRTYFHAQGKSKPFPLDDSLLIRQRTKLIWCDCNCAVHSW